MSTRSIINFSNDGEFVDAKIYRHSDGYPDGEYGVLADLERFFVDVQDQTNDHRFDDASHLAAKFVVWQVDRLRKQEREFNRKFYGTNDMPDLLEVIGVGIMKENPLDIQYEYMVVCDGTAQVKYRMVRFGESGDWIPTDISGENVRAGVV